MLDPAAAKTQLREQMRTTLQHLSESQQHERSLAACARLVRNDAFAKSRTVLLYLPIAGEVDVTSLALRCFQTGRTVCAPRVDWARKRMEAVEILGFDDVLEEEQHGVREPAGGTVIPIEELDMIITPGLAFDTACQRLGRGGGFYDRYLARSVHLNTYRVGICFDEQIVDTAPTEPHDVALDAIATDRRLIQSQRSTPA